MRRELWWVRAVGALALLAGCARAPSIAGARCGCPAGYHCDKPGDPAGVCVPGPAPDAAIEVVEDGLRAPGRCRHAGEASVRALRPDEVARSLRDLLGVDVATAGLASDDLVSDDTGFRGRVLGPYEPLVVSDAQRAVAHDAATRATIPPCPSDAATCRDELIDRLGLRTFRRPPTDDERAALVAAYGDAGAARHEPAARRLIEAMLASPAFFYGAARGAPPEAPGADRMLTGWERATRLSFLLTGSTPDEELLAAAGRGELDTVGGVRRAVARLLASPRALDVIVDFHDQWWALDKAETRTDVTGMPASVLNELRASAEATVRDLVGERDAPLGAIFGQDARESPALFGDADLAAFYDWLPRPPDGFARLVPAPGQQRFGLLTAPAFLAAFAHGADSAPILRGAFIVRTLMCSEVPPPPPVIPSPPPDPTLATRERYAQHTKDGNCRGCHSLFDNAGYGLENYDGFGRWRTEDHGKPIDLTGLDVAKIPFESLEGLASTLAARSSGCAARQWFRYALGRRERADDDLCTLPALEAAFAKGGGRTRALLEAIATSDAFLTAAR